MPGFGGQEESSGSESEVEASNKSFNTEKDDGFDVDEDFDFDGTSIQRVDTNIVQHVI